MARSARRGLLLSAALAALATLAAATVLFGRNLVTIDPGRLYRSAQLSAPELREVIEELGIATVLNLRGNGKQAEWYRAEVAVTREMGVALIDVGLSSRRLPHRDELLALVDAFRDAERPILVHCGSGADRSGLGSAVYVIDHMGRSREEALEMLSWRYRHLPISRPAMRYFVGIYQGEAWARRAYEPCTSDWDHYPRDRFCAGKP